LVLDIFAVGILGFLLLSMSLNYFDGSGFEPAKLWTRHDPNDMSPWECSASNGDCMSDSPRLTLAPTACTVEGFPTS
jgi:hypothetical protein